MPAPARLILIGASGHAKVVADAAARSGLFTVVVFLDDHKPKGTPFFGASVLGAAADLAALTRAHALDAFFVAIGDDAARARVADAARASARGLAFATIIHPSAVVAEGAAVGAGSVVMAGAVVQPGARVGEGVIVNTRASVDHDAVLEDFAAISPGVSLGGHVQVGAHAFVGIGASVVHGARIGRHCVVGAGAVVTGDLPSHTVAVGVPAKVIRSRREGEPYL
jgi:sugar O-acyltransferase (sialic acid O-acetyltransferase NeuD family)